MTLANGAKRHAELAPALHCTAPHTSRHARRVRHRSTIQAFGCRRTVQRMRVPIRRKRRRATTTVVVRNRTARRFALARAASRNHARHLPIAPCSALPMQARSEALGGAPPPARNLEMNPRRMRVRRVPRIDVSSTLAGRCSQVDTSRPTLADRARRPPIATRSPHRLIRPSTTRRFDRSAAVSPSSRRSARSCVRRTTHAERHAAGSPPSSITRRHGIASSRHRPVDRRQSRDACLAVSPRRLRDRRYRLRQTMSIRDGIRRHSRRSRVTGCASPAAFLAASSPLPRPFLAPRRIEADYRGTAPRRVQSRRTTPNQAESRRSTSARAHVHVCTPARLHVRTPMRPHGIASRHITSRRAQTKKSPRAFARGDFFGLSQLPDDSGKPHAVLTLPRPSASSAREPSRARWPASPGTSALRP